jgi:hypothetical protein
MNRFLFILTSTALSITTYLQAETIHPQTENSYQQLAVNNRILAKVNGKTISVLDVMKKMDVFLTRYYPQYASSPIARHQYFSTQWRDFLSQMIDNELILADAEKLELKITDSEVREAIIERFGPNIMASLDKLQMTYEEAKKMVQDDITVEKMTWYRIHSKALQNVNPQDIKIAYQDFLKKNPPQDNMEYQVLSIRTQDEALGEETAKKAHKLLCSAKKSLSEVMEEISLELKDRNDITVSLSDEIKSDSKTISDAHKSVLLQLALNSISEPIRQFSKTDKSAVYRIFHLKNHSTVLPPTFAKIADKLKNELIDLAIARESQVYIEKLREKFGYDEKAMRESIAEDFQPFILKP